MGGGGEASAEARATTTASFLFTDIEGSTQLLLDLGDRYADVLDDQRRIIGQAVADAGGRVFGHEGDALFASFDTATAALTAAAQAQRRLDAHDWPGGRRLRVRMGVHTGDALVAGSDYVGFALHQVARIMSAGHGGQVLVSEATRRLAAQLPAGLELRDLGERRLKDLTSPERLYQLAGEGLDDRFPPLRTLDTKQNNLPVQVTSFVGRDELVAAGAALASTRLLTLTGPGGTGKTRLAMQLAAEASDDFPDGVYFVGLDSVRDPNLVASAIASALGLTVAGGWPPLDAVIERLGTKRVLLILDNFEQVVDAAPDVARVLREASETKLIVTTRIVLHVYGEREFPVPPLGLPPATLTQATAAEASRYEAVRLFAERAMAVQPSFALTDDNAAAVVEIVRRLDGLPLAIELAAARTRVLPVAAIRARVDRHLSLLTGGARDLPERQQTLRGAIDWSYDLLEPPDRRLFERFSIHSGGAFLTQADVVCGPPDELGEDVLDGLTSLADKSLVNSRPEAGEDPRFTMLTTIRSYAHERLQASAEADALAAKHARTYLQLVEELAPRLIGADAAELNDRLEADHDNLRQALDWSLTAGDAEFALRFIAAIWRFWQTRGHLAEARDRVESVLSLPGIADQSTELVARGYGAAGGIAYWQADVSATHRYYKRALEAAREAGDERPIAEALYNFSFAALDQSELTNDLYAAGIPYLEQSLQIYERIGDSRGIADTNWALAQAVAAAGDIKRAAVAAESAVAEYRRLGDPFRLGWGLYMLAALRGKEGQLDDGLELLRESLAIFADAHDSSGILLNLAAFAVVAQMRGEGERAARLGGAVGRLRLATGAGLLDEPADYVDFQIPKRPTADADAERWWDEGGLLTTEEAIAYALETR